MSKELCFVIDQISREKGISRDALLSVLESALLSAVRKRFGERTNVTLRINPKTCDISVFEIKQVVEKVSNKDEEISIDEIKNLFPDRKIGGTVEIQIPLHDFGRIAAQTAKQVIFQKVKEAERDIIYNEYKDKVGQIISGTVLRKEKGTYYINLAKTEAVLPQRETLPNEILKRGDIVKAYLSEVRQTSKGPVILLTRTDPNFIISLFKMEVPEIHDGVVNIKNIAREPGDRTKIAVYSKDPSVDAVGACVGMKGTRVQSIVRELRGERIDIIPWNEDPRIFIAKALTPAVIDRIGINEEEKTAMVIADDQQLSLAIGKRGQNIKLATKLTGWDIEVISESEYSKIKMEEADKSFDEAVRRESKE
ncbi:MAG: transcription termination factor NusA [Thermodesulfovibrionales bacterium]|nr:transcription termination factor NusA [Thermodesulfovibrionales bacterium]